MFPQNILSPFLSMRAAYYCHRDGKCVSNSKYNLTGFPTSTWKYGRLVLMGWEGIDNLFAGLFSLQGP